jgi:hypothetical protein
MVVSVVPVERPRVVATVPFRPQGTFAQPPAAPLQGAMGRGGRCPGRHSLRSFAQGWPAESPSGCNRRRPRPVTVKAASNGAGQ